LIGALWQESYLLGMLGKKTAAQVARSSEIRYIINNYGTAATRSSRSTSGGGDGAITVKG